MTPNTPLAKILVGTLLIVSPLAHAQLYRWVDDDGRTIVSDTPPPAKYKAQQIRKGTTSASNGAPNVPAAVKGKEKPAAEETTRTVVQAIPPDAATCKHARENLQVLESGAPVTATGPSGERERMDDAARARETARTREVLRNCQN